jgi:hypothetical protein
LREFYQIIAVENASVSSDASCGALADRTTPRSICPVRRFAGADLRSFGGGEIEWGMPSGAKNSARSMNREQSANSLPQSCPAMEIDIAVMNLVSGAIGEKAKL